MPECTTQRCIDYIEEYGDGIRRVYPNRTGENGYRCEGCGAIWQDGVWSSRCQTCSNEVEAGGLVGLFVPHQCQSCHKQLVEYQRQNGHVCRNCRKEYASCCC